MDGTIVKNFSSIHLSRPLSGSCHAVYGNRFSREILNYRKLVITEKNEKGC